MIKLFLFLLASSVQAGGPTRTWPEDAFFFPTAAFGDVSTIQPTPEVFLSFQYNVNPAWTNTRKGPSATVGVANSMAKLQTGAVQNSSAVVTSASHVLVWGELF